MFQDNMDNIMDLRSVSFDTSFLLKQSIYADNVIKILSKDKINCFITSTVISELEQLKIWNRITNYEYRQAMKRWKNTNAKIIDFKNRFFLSQFGMECMISMKKHHGVKQKDIVNDCNILVTSLKNGVDLFLSEDFHFTSKITREVIHEVTNAACSEYHQMCDSELYSINAETFLKAYEYGKIDLDIIKNNMKSIRKSGKKMDY
jgi:rRNA-processing protein FCF1